MDRHKQARNLPLHDSGNAAYQEKNSIDSSFNSIDGNDDQRQYLHRLVAHSLEELMTASKIIITCAPTGASMAPWCLMVRLKRHGVPIFGTTSKRIQSNGRNIVDGLD